MDVETLGKALPSNFREDWTYEDTVRLAELYLQHDCLWNTDHRQYRNYESRSAAYKSIMKDMKKKNINRKRLQSKIDSFRSKYTKCLREMEKAARGEKACRKKWVLFDLFDPYLRPIVTRKRGCSRPPAKQRPQVTETSEVPIQETEDMIEESASYEEEEESESGENNEDKAESDQEEDMEGAEVAAASVTVDTPKPQEPTVGDNQASVNEWLGKQLAILLQNVSSQPQTQLSHAVTTCSSTQQPHVTPEGFHLNTVYDLQGQSWRPNPESQGQASKPQNGCPMQSLRPYPDWHGQQWKPNNEWPTLSHRPPQEYQSNSDQNETQMTSKSSEHVEEAPYKGSKPLSEDDSDEIFGEQLLELIQFVPLGRNKLKLQMEMQKIVLQYMEV